MPLTHTDLRSAACDAALR